jgi:hypothetical protein
MLLWSYNTINIKLTTGFDPAGSVKTLSIKDNFLSGNCSKVIIFGLGEFPTGAESAPYSVGTGRGGGISF